MSGILGSTHYAMSGAMESSPVDQHLIHPRSSRHGLRTISTTFGAELPPDWRTSPGWRAGSLFARQVGDLVDASKIDKSGDAPAFLFRVAAGVSPESLREIASRSAGRYGAFFRVAGNHVAFTSEAPRDSIVGEAMTFGKLYPGSSYATPVPASPVDAGLVVTRSGSSGFRGGKDPFTSSLTAADDVPRQDYQRYGGDIPLKTAPQLENVVNTGGLLFGIVGIALVYRAMGGGPLR